MSLQRGVQELRRSVQSLPDTLFPARDDANRSTVSLPNLNVARHDDFSPSNHPTRPRSALDVSTTQFNQKNASVNPLVQPVRDSTSPSQHLDSPGCTSDLVPTNSEKILQVPVPSTGPEICEWTSLNSFLRVLGQCSGRFDPLKKMVDDLVLCTEVYKSVGRDRPKFVALQVELEARFEELREHYSNDTPPTTTPSIGGLCRSIQQELVCVKLKEKLGPSTKYRIAIVTNDTYYILRSSLLPENTQSSSTIDSKPLVTSNAVLILIPLKLNTNISLWQINGELATNAHLKNLAPSLSACYKSDRAIDLRRGACTPGTRVDVLAQIHGWIHNRADGSVYWLNGMAGTGKTTIAYSLCTELELAHKLGASFFCSRLLPECRDVSLVFPSIAYQLAQFSQPFRCALSRILEVKQDISTKEPGAQFEELIVKPLGEVRKTLPEELVVVIDALDECDNQESTRRIIEAVLVKTSGLPIKLILVSRPEPQIREQMKKTVRLKAVWRLLTHDLDKCMVKRDIGLYLRSALESINPSKAEIVALTKRAGILFIYAATVVRYIGHANFTENPQQRLKNVLEMPSSGGANPYKETNELYTLILASAFDDPDVDANIKADLKELLFTILCAREPLTAGALSKFLSLHDVDWVYVALAPLESVLHIVESNGLVTTLHSSFPDYLFDSTRSKQYHCDRDARDRALMKHCFRYLRDTSPQFNICDLESSFVLDGSVPDLEDRVKKAVPAEMLYACRHWETHLQVVNGLSDTFDQLYSFLSSQLLLWIEVMNLNKLKSVSVEILRRVEEWCARQDCAEELKQLAYDSWRFMSRFASDPVSQSTPHIYVTMLPCWPAYRPVAKHYAKRWRSAILGNAILNRPLSLLATWRAGAIISLAWSPDGRHIAHLSSRGIYSYDSVSGEAVNGPLDRKTIENATCIGYSPDSARVVMGFADGTIRVWSVQSGKKLIGPLKGHEGEIKCVAFSYDGSRIASCSEDRTLRLWNGRTGKRVPGPLEGHTDSVNSLAFSPDSSHIVSGSSDGTIWMWHAQTGRPTLGLLAGHTDSINSLAFSPNGTHIVSGSSDGTIGIWNARTGQPQLEPLEGHAASVRSVACSSDGTRIVSGSGDNTILIWHAETGQPIQRPFEEHTGPVNLVAFSPDGTRIASGSEDWTLRMWDLRIREPMRSSLEGHTSSVFSVAFSLDGTRIVSGSWDNTVRVWDAQTGEPILGPLQGHTASVNSVAFSPDGTRIVSGSWDETIRMWDAQTGRQTLSPLKGHTDSVYSVAFSPDGTRIVSGSADGNIRMWDASNGKVVLGPLKGHASFILSIAFSHDGAHIVSGSYDNSIKIWDAQTGRPTLGPLKGHADAVYSVAFSPDDTRIVSGSADKSIRVWDTKTGKLRMGPLKTHTGAIFSVAFSPDGTRIASGSMDKTIQICDALTAQPILKLEGHTDSVLSLAFSPDGTRIVSGSADKTVRIWDVRTGQSLSDTPFPVYSSSWVVTFNGWVVDSTDRFKLLFWLPEDLRPKLLPPRQLGMLSAESDYINICPPEAFIGPSWTRGYLGADSNE